MDINPTHTDSEAPTGISGSPSPRNEEVLCSVYSSGWKSNMPVTLITYDSGKQDLHCQTGDHFTKALLQASEILAERGLVIDNKDDGFMGPTGVYFTVRKLALGYSNAEIEALMNQEPLPEGWTEFSEHETPFQKVKRTMKEAHDE